MCNVLAPGPTHNLGLATTQALGLSRDDRAALRRIRRKANAARHCWPTAAASATGGWRAERGEAGVDGGGTDPASTSERTFDDSSDMVVSTPGAVDQGDDPDRLSVRVVVPSAEAPRACAMGATGRAQVAREDWAGHTASPEDGPAHAGGCGQHARYARRGKSASIGSGGSPHSGIRSAGTPVAQGALDPLCCLVEAADRGAAAGGGTRQVVAAAVAAAIRTAQDLREDGCSSAPDLGPRRGARLARRGASLPPDSPPERACPGC